MANDNPWEEHIWSTTKPCKYILRYKGEEFVRAIRDKVEEADTVQTGRFGLYFVCIFTVILQLCFNHPLQHVYIKEFLKKTNN